MSGLETDTEKGLSVSEATNRKRQFGLNILTAHKKAAWWKDLLFHFKSPFVILLLIATIISYSVGEIINASIIFAMVITSVLIDFFQERDARNAAEELKNHLIPRTNLLVPDITV